MSFKLAADELGVTAGAVSQSVKTLEGQLGVDLFRRLPRGLLLTPVGEGYLPPLYEAFRIISQATETIAPALPTRKLRIGVSVELKKHLPPDWPKRDAELQLHVIRSEYTDDAELVRSGKLDGIVRLQRTQGHGLSSEKIAIIRCKETMHEVHFIAVPGLAGCRQSRALVSNIQKLFVAHKPYIHVN